MSKVRVYELARELGLEHTHVEVRCRQLGIDVDNHLAQLDEGDVVRVKAALEADPASEVQEKRVRKTVIRRRAREMRQSIMDFEPRLDSSTLRVEPLDQAERINAVTFLITGDVGQAAHALPVKFKTDVDAEIAAVEVRE